MPSVLIVDVAGCPVQWSDWQKAALHIFKGSVAWDSGDVLKVVRGEHSQLTIPSVVALKQRHKRPAFVPRVTNHNLFIRDDLRCGYCGVEGSFNSLTRDHIHPVSKGGENTWTNCITACWKCNNQKKDMSLSEFGIPLRKIPSRPSHAELLLKSNPEILTQQRQFLETFLNNR